MTNEYKRPLSFGERFAITFILLMMVLSGGCTVYVLATATGQDDWLLRAYAGYYGGGFFAVCFLTLLIVLARTWWARRN